VARGDPLPQVVQQAGGAALLPGIPVTLQRIPGTNRFTSSKLVLVDARCDGDQLNEADKVFVRGGPGGFLRATFRPASGGPAFSDEAVIEGEPPTL
jgi:hypothetical protein